MERAPAVMDLMHADCPSLPDHDRGSRGLAEGDLLTVAQALRLLPVGRATLYQLVEEGQIPHVRVRTAGSHRGRILVERAGLEAYVERLRDGRLARQVHAHVDVDGILRRVRKRA